MFEELRIRFCFLSSLLHWYLGFCIKPLVFLFPITTSRPFCFLCTWKSPSLIFMSSAYTTIPGGSVVKNLPINIGNSGSFPGLGRSLGKGNGNPFQYSCLGNPVDRGDWQAAVHGVLRVRHNLVTKQQCTYRQNYSSSDPWLLPQLIVILSNIALTIILEDFGIHKDDPYNTMVFGSLMFFSSRDILISFLSLFPFPIAIP